MRPRRKRPIVLERHLLLDQHTRELDMHVLDVLAQVEFLPSRAREVQR
jgi:hypothetical protein